MTSSRTHRLSLDLNRDALAFFFPKARNPKQSQIADRVRSAFDKLDGNIRSLSISDTQITLEWNENSGKPDKLGKIAQILSEGNYADGILLLEFFRSESPDDTDILYNLGMAYSDQNKLTQAIELLSRLVEIKPDHINGRVARGVAYLRNDNIEAGVGELQAAVEQAPDNPWAQRNLGVGLMRLQKFSEAAVRFRTATELAPRDQHAWYGYAQALEAAGSDEADAAYIRTIDLDEYSQIAELARQARTKVAQKNFRQAAPLRMDAVMYCLGALEKFEAMSMDEVKKIGFEIAMLGTRGIDVNNPGTRYTLKNLPGDFSGLHLLSIQYVAFKKFAPEQDIGFDLGREYEAALKLFKK